MRGFRIRDAIIPGDRPHLEKFILGSQHFEKAFEPNRRLDDEVAAEYFDQLSAEVAKRKGRMLVAVADDGSPLGWAVVHTAQDEAFVTPDERKFGYISELYVAEEARSRGIGRALILACEDWVRALGLKTARIGVLEGNERARQIYDRAGFAPYANTLRKYL